MNKAGYKKPKKREYRLLTTAEAQELLVEQKAINHVLGWWPIPDSKGTRWRLEASVWAPFHGVELKLYGNIGRTNYSFALTYKGYCLRTYNVHTYHHNPDCRDITGPHKQDWHEEYGTSWAYIVNDISTDNINSASMDFLKESNIKALGGYQQILL